MTYPPDTPPSTYPPDAGSAYLSTEDTAFARPATPDLGSDGADSSTTEIAKQHAAEVGGTAAEAGQQVAEVAKEQAANVAGQAKTEAKNLLGQTRSELTSQAGSQQQRAASGLRSLGNELQSMSSNSEGDGPASEVARQAADRINSAASWLENRDPGQVLSEVQRFARQRPGVFLGLAAGAGLLAGRLTRGLTAGDSANQPNGGSAAGQYDSQVAGMAGTGTGTAEYGTAEYGTAAYGTEPSDTAYGTPAYGTEPSGTAYGTPAYGTEPYGTEPYGAGAPGTQAYGAGSGSGLSADPPTAPPAAWEQDPISPTGDGGYGPTSPGSGGVGR